MTGELLFDRTVSSCFSALVEYDPLQLQKLPYRVVYDECEMSKRSAGQTPAYAP